MGDRAYPSRRAFLIASLGALTHCQKRAPSAASPRRLVSLSPSTTETIHALGALGLLVGRSRYCDFPPEVQALPQVGGFTDPNLEAILALRPDLVVGARGPAGPALFERLQARGIAAYFPPTESFSEIEQMIAGLGQRIERGRESDALLARMQARRASLDDALAGRPRPRTLLLFGVTPIVAAGPGSFADEMLRRAGGDNVLRGASTVATTAYPTLALEQVIALDPDVILDAAIMEHRDQSTLGGAWTSVRAVREGKVRPLRDEAVLRPGPRVLDGVASLAGALHPGVTLP